MISPQVHVLLLNVLQVEKLRVCVDATMDAYKVVPDALMEALDKQNKVLVKEEVNVLTHNYFPKSLY